MLWRSEVTLKIGGSDYNEHHSKMGISVFALGGQLLLLICPPDKTGGSVVWHFIPGLGRRTHLPLPGLVKIFIDITITATNSTTSVTIRN